MTQSPRDIIADANERHMFAPHELPLDAELHAKYLDNADHILTALHAAGYTIEQDWQPIETAPKDGPYILAHWRLMPHFPIVVRWDRRLKGWQIAGGKGRIEGLTHWRPLPAPPADAKDSP